MHAIGRILSVRTELVRPLLIFAVVFFIAWAVRALVLRALGAWNARTGSRPGLILVEALRGPALIWAVILASHIAIQSSDLPAKYAGMEAKTLAALWVLSLTLMCMRLAGNLVHYYGGQAPGALPVTTLTQNLAQLAVFILGIAILLKSALGIEVTPILTALGVGGLAVALALQDTLSNLFGGFYVAVAGQIRLGDYIKLNTGEEGYVADIGWRSTTIRALANNMIIVPNAKLAQAIVTNYCLPEKHLAASVQVGVGYESDPDQVERVLLELAAEAVREIPGMLAEPAPGVVLDPGFGDSSLGFTLNFHVAEFANQFAVRAELRKRILLRFKREGIDMPYPTRTVRLARPDGGQPPEDPATGPGKAASN
jgi:small-conductance mechanosensitive channel